MFAIFDNAAGDCDRRPVVQDALLDGVERAIVQLVDASRALSVLIVGAPVRRKGLFNAAIAIKLIQTLRLQNKEF